MLGADGGPSRPKMLSLGLTGLVMASPHFPHSFSLRSFQLPLLSIVRMLEVKEVGVWPLLVILLLSLLPLLHGLIKVSDAQGGGL